MLSAENIWVTPPPPSREAKVAQIRAQQQGINTENRLKMNYHNTFQHYNNSSSNNNNNSRGSDSNNNNITTNNYLTEEGERARQAHQALSHPYGDFHTYLHVYNSWIANNKSIQWCERNYVNFRSIKTVANIRYVSKMLVFVFIYLNFSI